MDNAGAEEEIPKHDDVARGVHVQSAWCRLAMQVCIMIPRCSVCTEPCLSRAMMASLQYIARHALPLHGCCPRASSTPTPAPAPAPAAAEPSRTKANSNSNSNSNSNDHSCVSDKNSNSNSTRAPVPIPATRTIPIQCLPDYIKYLCHGATGQHLPLHTTCCSEPRMHP